MILVGFFYLVEIHRVSAGGFEVNTLGTKAEELRRINQKLELEVTELQSLEAIHEHSKKFDLVRVHEVDYLSISRGVVALEE